MELIRRLREKYDCYSIQKLHLKLIPKSRNLNEVVVIFFFNLMPPNLVIFFWVNNKLAHLSYKDKIVNCYAQG